MKQSKNIIPFDYSALISPIKPRISSFDGVGSLFNIIGTYYDEEPNLEDLWKASSHISTLSDSWKKIGLDLFKATKQFAELNNIDQISSFEYKLPKDYNLWKSLLNPKK